MKDKKFNLKSQTFVLLLLGSLTMQPACQSDNEKTNTSLPTAKPIRLKSEYTGKMEQDNRFAFDLLNTALECEKQPNIILSPLSINMALSMTLNGTKGDTFDEIQKTLHAENHNLEEINEYNQIILKALLDIDPSTKIHIANSIWNKLGYPFETVFKENARSYYAAEIKTMDFSDPNTVKLINKWCFEQTKGLIPEILDKIPPSAITYLINAVYFKGIWSSGFDKSQTQTLPFYAEDGTQTSVSMMQQTNTFNYTTDNNAAYLELPYGNKAFSMVVMLPHKGKTCQNIINRIKWTELTFTPQPINLHFPRFKAACKYELHSQILPKMGVNKAFTSEADFTNLTPTSAKLSRIIHKTCIEINEEGTETTGLTAVETLLSSNTKTKPTDFIVNKPFLLAIRENSTGIILFIGKIGKL